MIIEALELARNFIKFNTGSSHYVIEQLDQAIADFEKQEPVAVKRMKEWIVALKRRSDNGEHMKIDSGLSAGTCWELAIELEQFINTHPQPKREWVGLTVMEAVELELATNHPREFAAAIEAKLKEKNGYGISSDMKQEHVAKTAKQRHEENT